MTEAAISLPKRVLKNFLSLSFGEVIARALSFLAVAYLARILGAEGFGALGFASAILVFFIIFVQNGFDTLGIREIAKGIADVKLYVQNIITIKLILSVISYGLLFIFVYFIPQPVKIKKIILLYGLTLFTFTFTLNWVFLGLERMQISAAGVIITQLVYVAGIFLFIKHQDQLLQVPIIKVSAEIVTLLFYLALFRKSFGMIQFRFNFPLWKRIFTEAFPIAFSAIVTGINYNFDLVMLGFMKGAAVVGWYNASYKVVLFILGIVTLYHLGVFPIMSRYYDQQRSDFENLASNSIRVTIIIALPIGIFGTLLAEPVMDIIYGNQYHNGIIPFQVLIWAIAIIIVRTNYKIILITANRQKDYMWLVIYASIINIVLNLILIPPFSLVGAAIATSISEATLLIMVYRKVSKSVIQIPFLSHLIKPAVSAIIMGLPLYLLSIKETNLFIAVFIGMGIYLSSLILLKTFSLKEIQFLYK